MPATNYNKLKTNLRLAIQRLKMMEKKKTENAQKCRREIAAYIASNKVERAKIRVEAIIREDYLVEALEIVEMYCDLLLTRFGLIEQMKTLDDGLAEAISSIIWVAPRIADISELKIIVDLLTQKYGKQYVMAVREGAIKTVNENLKKKMNIEELPKIMVERYMIEIAKDQNVNYVPDPEVMKTDEIYLAEEAIANKRPGFLIDFDPNLGPPPLPLANPSVPYTGPPIGFNYNYNPNPSGPPVSDMPPEKFPDYGYGKGAVGGNTAPYFPPPDPSKSPYAPPHNFPENMPPHEVPNYDPPNYHSMFPDNKTLNNQPTANKSIPPAPAPRKSKMPTDVDDFELPDLPDIPDSLPDLDGDDKNDPPNDDNIDFDDLAARFEALKKKK
ncbi:IST1 homolog [Tetranychus urticae]|uniref:IST1 homolog n=1 Tax=Tetranychus urticae TaxID=32264 RepID=T1KA41_TETUR|nr:IST1 homolog [Tetranychus urticae]